MIQLIINNTTADLKPSSTITQNEKRDIFNLQVIEASFSLPFDLAATDKNRKLLGFIDLPSSTTTFEKEYQASIDYCGVIQLSGQFVLRRANKVTGFNGYFKSDAGDLSTFSDTNIKELISETFTVNARTDIAAINAIITNNIVFPRHFDIKESQNAVGSGTVERNVFYNPAPLLVGATFERYRPTIKIKYILEKVLEELGYQVQYNITDNTFDQLIWIPRSDEIVAEYSFAGFPNPPDSDFPKTWEVSDLLPNLTFSEFLRSIRANFNLYLQIDSVTRIVTINDAADLTETLDITPYTVPSITIERIEDDNFSTNSVTFSVAPQQDPTQTEQLPPVRRYADAIPDVFDVGKTVIAEFDCYYYECVLLRPFPLGVVEYVPFTRNTVGRTITGLSQSVESQLSPVPNAEVIFRNFTNIETVDNGSGNVRLKINGQSFFGAFAIGSTQIRLIDNPEDPIPYDLAFTDILAIGFGFVDIDMIYQEDISLDLQSRSAAITDPQPFLRDEYQEGAGGGVSIYHGIYNTTDSLTTYAYASASAFSTDYITQISNSALIFETDLGIYEQYYKALEDQFGEANKKATFTSWLPIHLLPKRQANFMIVKGVKYLVNQFKFQMRNQDTERVKCTIESRIT